MAFEKQRKLINDMIVAASKHARKYNRKIERIELHPTRWLFFSVDMRERFPEKMPDQFDEVQFKHFIVSKGSKLMTEPLNIIYKKPTANA